MTFKELQDEVIALRFESSQRASIKSWINLRYSYIWNLADWGFKTVSQIDLPVTAASRTPTMPPDLAKVLDVYDTTGCQLNFLPRQNFESMYPPTGIYASTSTQGDYTVIDRQIYLDFAPGSNQTFKIDYKRRLSHVDTVAGITGGIMIEDADQPLWPAEHDYALVVDTVILGQQILNDPTWTQLVPQRDELLQSMKNDLTWNKEETVTQWSGDYGNGNY